LARRIRRGTTRTALGLYGSLLVLPTLIFGFLYWRELEKDFTRQEQEVPERAKKGADRIIGGVRNQLERLVASETARPVTQYAEFFVPEEARGDQLQPQSSPIVSEEPPDGVLSWFSFEDAPDSDVRIFAGTGTFNLQGEVEAYRSVVRDLRARIPPPPRSSPELRGEEESLDSRVLQLTAVSVMLSYKRDPVCVEECYPLFRGRPVNVGISDFLLYFFVDPKGFPRAAAVRRVVATSVVYTDPFFESSCMRPYDKGFGLTQGFLIDCGWLLKDVPFELARRLLDEDEELRNRKLLPIEAQGVPQPFFPIRELGFATFKEEDLDYGELEVVVDTNRIYERIGRQSTRFFAVGGMLVFTLVAGMTLLYRSVRSELEQAQRMQNFVAAVTHELRTPLSTIRLHAEMLLEGWVSDPEKQHEYYQRIMRETGRLSTLVERILEKSRLKEKAAEAEPTDLNATIRSLFRELENPGSDDLTLDLATGLPRVWLTREALQGILTNLVENARKYGPGTRDDPLLIRTYAKGAEVRMEVLDRGPGVPPEEREKIFEAFYRVGSEATRTTIGTGLGLHLVSLHAETCRARVSVHDREGGGSAFRIAFRPA